MLYKVYEFYHGTTTISLSDCSIGLLYGASNYNLGLWFVVNRASAIPKLITIEEPLSSLTITTTGDLFMLKITFNNPSNPSYKNVLRLYYSDK